MIGSRAECRGIAHSLNSPVHLARLSTLNQRRQSDTDTLLSIVCGLLPLLAPFPMVLSRQSIPTLFSLCGAPPSVAVVGTLAVPLFC